MKNNLVETVAKENLAKVAAAIRKFRARVLEEAAREVLCTRAVPEKLNDWWFGERTKLAKRIRKLKEAQ